MSLTKLFINCIVIRKLKSILFKKDYKILSICKIELTSLITNILETLNLSLTNTNEKDKFENDIKLAIIEEIEKCLKFKTGTLKQILDKNTLNIENKTYPKVYEDLIAKAIIKKVLYFTLISSQSSNVTNKIR